MSYDSPRKLVWAGGPGGDWQYMDGSWYGVRVVLRSRSCINMPATFGGMPATSGCYSYMVPRLLALPSRQSDAVGRDVHPDPEAWCWGWHPPIPAAGLSLDTTSTGREALN